MKLRLNAVCSFALGLVVICALAAGCASVKTLPDSAIAQDMKLRRPTRIVLEPFDTTHGMWRGRAANDAVRAEVRDWLVGRLDRHLAAIAPTELREDPLPRSGWLLTGRFIHVNPGSRLKRMFLGGVGAGASKLETKVEVFDLAVSTTEPILTFTTTGGSNLATGVPGAMSATDDDVERTAREIVDYLESRLWKRDKDERAVSAPAAMEEIEIEPASRGRR